MDSVLLAALLALAVIASGLGWLSALPFRSKSAAETLGWGFVIGSVWLTAIRMIVSTLTVLAHPIVMWVFLLLPIALIARGKKLPTLSKGLLGFMPTFGIVLLCLWFAAQKPMWNIDALRRWGLHAKWTAVEQTLVPETVQEQAWASTHPSYPPLVPSLLAFGIDNDADPDVGLRPFMPFYFLALLGILYGFTARRNRLLASGLTFAFACTPAFFWQSQMGLGADAVLADIPLALFVAACAIAVLFHHEGKAGAWQLAAIAGVGAALTKQEGLLIALAVVTLGLLIAWLRKSKNQHQPLALAWAIGATLFGIGWWKILARNMPVMEGENYLSTASIATLFGQLDRLPVILTRLGQEMSPGIYGGRCG